MRHRIADIYKAGVLAARLERHDGGTRFSYLPAYLQAGGPAVATSLPLSSGPVLSAAGAAPPYFTGLLPEGRRLNALRRSIKTSADDDLSLLIAAGANPVGDVQIVGHGEPLGPDDHAVPLDPRQPVDFDQLLGDPDLIDPVALAGVQDKMSAGMISVPVTGTGHQFILKLNAPEFPHVVENELVMFRYAAKLRIPLGRVRLIRDIAGRPGLLVERFDRLPEPGAPEGVRRLAVEDAAQVLKLYPADKYNVGYSDVCRALASHCAAPLPALRNLAIQGAFAWLTGNGDLHAKNVSMVQQPHGEWTIAPVYDIPSTVVYGDKTLALTLDGKRTGISRRHFLGWATQLGLTERAAAQVLDLALKATGPLIADLEAGTAFRGLNGSHAKSADDGGSPFSGPVTRAWVKELKHRRRLLEG
ncbi:capsule biosynthesis enzymes related protein [Pseudarthrobacter phenanthrenivorans Sphe3]|uniref:Capsule biosynthesis enzymes related protein n=1 Tax=Pseudarthrobacter phenanthrenivorans (strain DSM 18606 / JCM 16027 / LMG 23796 / Sphe3) TaxID=930171 RepID=F0M8H0_PSEPM|nr:HipA domain-containing protein [Pseudarthrobacter phenanthrenivorans]ADX74888.1 capsule biosynthesis enzymes related protein [Pseudarthrobacter phenanthrenivorans Sphe3]